MTDIPKLIEFAKDEGVPYSAIAMFADVSDATVGKWRKGESEPTDQQLEAIQAGIRYRLGSANIRAEPAEDSESEAPSSPEPTFTRPEVIVGIDPGAKAGIAVVSAEGELLESEMAPTTKVKVGRNRRTYLDCEALAARITQFQSAYNIREVRIEKVGARPKQGLSSTFHFGHQTGVLIGMWAAKMGTNPTEVQPKEWQRATSVAGGEDIKENARAKAREIFGADHFPHKNDSDKADAALIAFSGVAK